MRALPLAALALLLAGCSTDFVPGSVIQDQRILALVADPPALGPPTGAAQPLTVTAYDAAPPPGMPAPGAPGAPEEAWSFCPLSAGASTGYACAVPACELPLTPAGRTVTVDPFQEAEACLALLGGSLPGVPGTGSLPAKVEVLVRYRLLRGGAVAREAVQRIPVWTTAPPAGWTANRQPVVTRVSVAGQADAQPCPDPADTSACPPLGTAAPGARVPVAVELDPASIDTYQDGTGKTVGETVVVSFFTTAGRFTEDRGEAPVAATELKLEDLGGASEALVWAVARDLRGGVAVVGPYRVAIAAP